MFSIPKLPILIAAGLLSVTGCAHHQGAKGPFSDVAQRHREEPTDAEHHPIHIAATGPALAVVPTTQPSTPTKSASGLPVPPQTSALVPSTTQRTVVAPKAAEHEVAAIHLLFDGNADLERAWPITVHYRPSGDTLAGPTYWPSTNTAYYRPDWLNTFMEPLEFLYNTILLPYRAVVTPPLSRVVYSPVNPVGGNPR